MKPQILIGIALLLTLASSVPLSGWNKRLIQVNEHSEPQWLTEEEVFFLIKLGVGFMDITETPRLHEGPVPKVAMAFPSGPTHQTTVNGLFPGIVHQRYIDDLTYFSQNFYTRYYRSETGVQSANWLFDKVKAAAALGSANRTTVSQFTHAGYDQKSIIATLQGKNVNGPIVVIGAHQDSINSATPATGRSPGADDNGSGSISVLEIFRVLVAANFVPELTIEFQWYAAEEVGLLGSQAIAQAYKNAGRSVYAMFNLDMTAYTQPGLAVKVLYDFTNLELADFTTTIVEEYTSLTWRTHSCGYGCSDHASYNRAGYPSSSIFEPQTNPQIHTQRDDLNLVNWDQTLQFIRLGLAVIVELSYGQ